MSRQFWIIAVVIALSITTGNLHAGLFSVADPPKNIGTPVNTAANDFAPALGPDGRYMIFNSNRGGKYQDLYRQPFQRWGMADTPAPGPVEFPV